MLLCAHKYAQSGRLCYYVHTNMHNLEDYATMCTQICTIWKIMLLCGNLGYGSKHSPYAIPAVRFSLDSPY